MIFSSTLFLFLFLPATLLIYYLIPAKYVNARNYELLAMSLIFYAWGEPKNIILMFFSIFLNYIFGLLLRIFDEKKGARKAVLIVSVIFNLGMLFFFKYFGFFTGNRFGTIALPIGISFFTFQIMSYTIDVYRRNVPAQTNVAKLGLYISLFPQLIAGPIVRYIDVANELNDRTCTLDATFRGVVRFSMGLAKKVVISNTVALLADTIFALDPKNMTAATAWLGALAYMLQIYFDFSGYSDMAIGIGDMLGFHFPENFDYPYISSTVQEFWRRWHMTLSTWFRDYLYIPLGGNRKGKIRTYINLLIVFACTGFWHGASFNFLIWGLYHGLFLVIERLGFKKVLEKLPKFLGRIYTLLVVIVGWVFFRADTLTAAVKYLGAMFRFTNFGWVKAVAQLDGYTIVLLLTAIVLCMPVYPKVRQKLLAKDGGETVVPLLDGVLAAVLVVISIYCLSGSDYNPFIYFRF